MVYGTLPSNYVNFTHTKPAGNPCLKMWGKGSPSRALMHCIRVRMKADSRQRLLEATPAPLLSVCGLTHQQEIFLNKVTANAAYAPQVLDKCIGARQAISITCPRCPHCRGTIQSRFTPPHLELLSILARKIEHPTPATR